MKKLEKFRIIFLILRTNKFVLLLIKFNKYKRRLNEVWENYNY